MFRKKKDYIDHIIKLGAFVQPPKKEPAETSVVVESDPIPEPTTVEAVVSPMPVSEVAEALRRRWQETTSEIPATEYAEYEESPEPMIGDICDLVVVSWGRKNPTGTERSAIGLARVITPGRKNRKGSTDGLFMRETNVVTEGEIRVGAKIRAKLAPPESDGHCFSLVEISIYLD